MEKKEDNSFPWVIILVPLVLIMMLYKCLRETPKEKYEREEFEEVTPRP
jgi:hypothetical protein